MSEASENASSGGAAGAPEQETAALLQPPAPAAERKPGLGARLGTPALLIALAALAATGWLWNDTRGELRALRQELAKRLTESDVQSKESRIVAEQVRDAVAEAQVKLGVLESRIAESQNQQIALEELYQELSRNRDDWAYAEIEQSISIANQQLQLAGNVKAALIALQSADARLQRMDRPQLTALRRTINRDMERLQALPYVDTLAISTRLDTIIAGVDEYPLAMETRPQPEAQASPPAEIPAWERFLREAWADFKQLVRVQRTDKPEVPLLAPTQSFFLRENLKLRLIGARLALLARDPTSYKADLKAARDWLLRYYDANNNNVAHAASVLRNLHEADVSIETPDINATLEAARSLRLARDRTTR